MHQNVKMELTVRFSSIVNKYPSFIKLPHHKKTGLNWLEGRRADDGAEGLWRIFDKLYDVSDFVDKHPGGKEWLTMTKVTRLI